MNTASCPLKTETSLQLLLDTPLSGIHLLPTSTPTLPNEDSAASAFNIMQLFPNEPLSHLVFWQGIFPTAHREPPAT